MHEIITLQFGNQSNYIGTHFWNAQESYFTYSASEESPIDHDVNFRATVDGKLKAGLSPTGTETFTPRVLIYDTKENFGTLRRVNALYALRDDHPAHTQAWPSNPILQQQPRIPPHPYQVSLDAGTAPDPIASPSVRYWSDFNRVFYHPRSSVQLLLPSSNAGSGAPSEGPNASQLSPLDLWESGASLVDPEEGGQDLLDGELRQFVEECDSLQGFQVFTGADDAWAAFSAGYVERLRDEYGRKSIFVWASESDTRRLGRERKTHAAVNIARATSIFGEQASLYIPVSTAPTLSRQGAAYLNLEPRSPWQTAALAATAVESFTLPTRLRSNPTSEAGATMNALETEFTTAVRRNVVELSLTASPPLPTAPLTNGTSAGDTRTTNGIHSPSISSPGEETEQPETLDIYLSNASPAVSSRSPRRTHTFHQTLVLRGAHPTNVRAAPQEARSPASVVKMYNTALNFPLPSSFPAIFTFPSTQIAVGEEGVAVQTALTASTRVAGRFEDLAVIAGRAARLEEREELRADLLARAESYLEGYDSGESEGDD